MGDAAYSPLNLLNGIVPNKEIKFKSNRLEDYLVEMKGNAVGQQVREKEYSKQQEVLEELKVFFRCYEAGDDNLDDLVLGIRQTLYEYNPVLFNPTKTGQQDASDFLLAILDMLETNVFTVDEQQPSGWVSVPYKTMDLNLVGNSLEECFENYFKERGHVTYNDIEMFLETKVKEFPQVLPIRLKRYDNDLRLDSKPITVPPVLDLSKYGQSGTPVKYQLKAVIQHKGATIKSGHYVAIADVEGTWKLFDDSRVSDAPESDIRNGSAFIYERIPEDEPEVEVVETIQTPQGLKNDGSLCYINVLLQSLRAMSSVKLPQESNAAIREGLKYPKGKFQNVQEVLGPLLDHFNIERTRSKNGSCVPVVGGAETSLERGVMGLKYLQNHPAVLPVISDGARPTISKKITLGNDAYELKSGIINVNQNHYYAVVKIGKKWFHCNDETVKPITVRQAQAELKKATTFFYEKS